MSLASERTVIRGLACPFSSPTWVRGVLEEVVCEAFKDVDGRSVEVHAFGHGGPVIAARGQVRLWQNEKGLFFQASLPADVGLSSILSLVRSGAGCSVNFDGSSWRAYEGERSGYRYRTIFDADIDHIAIAHGAAYRSTAVWLKADEQHGRLPDGLRQIANAARLGEGAQLLGREPRAAAAAASPIVIPSSEAATNQPALLFRDFCARRDVAVDQLVDRILREGATDAILDELTASGLSWADLAEIKERVFFLSSRLPVGLI